MEEQKKSYLRQIVTHTQLHIVGNMLGPLCKVWKHTESERNDILTLGEDEMAGKSYQWDMPTGIKNCHLGSSNSKFND